MADTKKLLEPGDIVRLWIHECNRVFQDRLINAEDRNWFTQYVSSQVRSC